MMPTPRTSPTRAGTLAATAILLMVTGLARPASAQQPVVTDTMYQRAHALVSRGQGEQGRALIDSMLRATPAGTPAYAEGLFWRAVTAANVEDAERDYLRLVIEFPLSPRSEDALLRLAELEMMRGDRTRAQRHLQRLIIEHPNGPARARASYWLARVFFEGNDLPRACNELNVARARAAAGDVELRNQLDYQAQRCVGVNVVVAPQTPPTQAPGASASVQSPPPASGGAGSTSPASTGASSGGLLPPPTSSGATSSGATSSGATSSGATSTTGSTPGASRSTTSPPAPRAPGFTVQVAAFPTKAAADKFMESLRTKGYDVRVWGVEQPFRVRIGHYGTRAEAAAVAQELRARMISKDAFVTEAEVR